MIEIGLAWRVAECPIGFGASGFFDDGGEGDSDMASRFEIDRRRDHKSPISFGHPDAGGRYHRQGGRPSILIECVGRPPSSGVEIELDIGAAAFGFYESLETCPLPKPVRLGGRERSEEHTSELQSLMRTSYAVFCLKKK